MGLSMMFYYRRNLNGIPESIQRAMHKQAMRDRTAPRSFSCDSAQSISGTSWRTPSDLTSRRCSRRATITSMSAFSL